MQGASCVHSDDVVSQNNIRNNENTINVALPQHIFPSFVFVDVRFSLLSRHPRQIRRRTRWRSRK